MAENHAKTRAPNGHSYHIAIQNQLYTSRMDDDTVSHVLNARDPYILLSLPPDASSESIKASYKRCIETYVYMYSMCIVNTCSIQMDNTANNVHLDVYYPQPNHTDWPCCYTQTRTKTRVQQKPLQQLQQLYQPCYRNHPPTPTTMPTGGKRLLAAPLASTRPLQHHSVTHYTSGNLGRTKSAPHHPPSLPSAHQHGDQRPIPPHLYTPQHPLLPTHGSAPGQHLGRHLPCRQ